METDGYGRQKPANVFVYIWASISNLIFGQKQISDCTKKVVEFTSIHLSKSVECLLERIFNYMGTLYSNVIYLNVYSLSLYQLS